jgi:hypothetical protein
METSVNFWRPLNSLHDVDDSTHALCASADVGVVPVVPDPGCCFALLRSSAPHAKGTCSEHKKKN